MLAKRIIPCLDVDRGRVVKGKRFQKIRDVADPVELAKRYNNEGADELVFYDITASNEDRNIFVDIVEKVATEINIPFTVGGGLRSVMDIHRVLHAGADKVSINSAAIRNPALVKEAASKFGSQCVVLSIDAKLTSDMKWSVFMNGGRIDTEIDAIEWARRGEELGAGEIVVNAIDVDGVKNGYNLNLTRSISEAVNIPVVASGGAGKKEHFTAILKEGKADAALAASVFHYDEIKIPDLKKYLAENGITMRRETSWT
ncbi:imidazole glycerol phosphate synthase subunit HisF [Virgibacillus oceani]|uniref:Imidazole glycerol phosphate synthase subunit HisF n=1 Tax=Virgibacillus oceani TaxID=1479511 RepID=A0A917M658_9BACI|nr:imidazole glycerol phosphate synthase subunit HisF [Virgibacillus oceani]GGG81491.1 imidazole glycerol phosphate synthase subunit HisF [Virgibacillus oceani]